MGGSSENHPTDTLEAITRAEKSFRRDLLYVAGIRKKRDKSKTLTDSHVREAESYLNHGAGTRWVRILVTHALEVVGSCTASFGVAAVGASITAQHKLSELTVAILLDEIPVNLWLLIGAGVLLVIVGIVLREVRHI